MSIARHLLWNGRKDEDMAERGVFLFVRSDANELIADVKDSIESVQRAVQTVKEQLPSSFLFLQKVPPSDRKLAWELSRGGFWRAAGLFRGSFPTHVFGCINTEFCDSSISRALIILRQFHSGRLSKHWSQLIQNMIPINSDSMTRCKYQRILLH